MLARSACLGDLSRPQRIVLKLRAGVGAAAPRSRAAVARRLRITIRRVTRLEHSGLRRLRAACGAATTQTAALADTSAPPAPGSTLAQAPPGQPVSSTTRGAARTATPAPSVESEGPADQGGVAGQSATNLPQPGKGGLNLWIPLFLLACGAAGFVVARALSRPVAAGGAPPEPAPGHWSTPPAGGIEAPPIAAPPPAPRAIPTARRRRAADAPLAPLALATSLIACNLASAGLVRTCSA